ncbi:DMT family transporter [Halobacteriovorax sp. GB3]|uniref:DMT family transporter n=1 Tax=Halobacteriovorax sp. GB3 TaxID=2719615 RepID=UPI002360952B|nr:DMT family transporter [Halobacteriovorax sp. GB3]MDD0853548.1 DMT family transporter [Halobacteriovorax sp. GB3]
MKLSTLIIIASLLGVALATQGAMNAQVGRITKIPLFASLISFSMGTISILFIYYLTNESLPLLSDLKSVPPLFWLAGCLGALFVSSVIILIPKLGASLLVSCIIFGQLSFSLFIDYYGLFGLEKRPISILNIIGFTVIILGIYLIKLR